MPNVDIASGSKVVGHLLDTFHVIAVIASDHSPDWEFGEVFYSFFAGSIRKSAGSGGGESVGGFENPTPGSSPTHAVAHDVDAIFVDFLVSSKDAF